MTFYTRLKIILAFILAGMIAIIIVSELNSLNEKTYVIIAKEDIEERKILSEDMLERVEVIQKQKDIMLPHAVTSKEELKYAIALKEIKKGEIIQRNEDVLIGTKELFQNEKYIDELGKVNVSKFINEEKRIITIRLEENESLDQNIKKGDFVDVIYTSIKESEKNYAVMILQHIKVFDISSEEKNRQRNISLEVTSQQAVELAYAKRIGKLDLTLNPNAGESDLVYPISGEHFLKQFQE